jgi:hypothetical protein
MSTVGPFPGDKERPGRDADHSSSSSAEVENEQELYLLSPQALAYFMFIVQRQQNTSSFLLCLFAYRVRIFYEHSV